jgi:hypothetical protein
MSMYPLALENRRQRFILVGLRKKLAGIIPAGKIQPLILRAFAPLEANKSSVLFSFSSDDKVLKGENLLINARLAVVNGMALGIAKVPKVKVANEPDKLFPGNMIMTSCPHPALFLDATDAQTSGLLTGTMPGDVSGIGAGALSVTELECIRMFWNSMVTFKIDQSDLLDTYPASQFNISDGNDNCIVHPSLKPIDLQTTHILHGDKSNKLQLDYMDGLTTKIEGNDHCKLFGVCEFHGFTVVTSSAEEKARVQAALGRA